MKIEIYGKPRFLVHLHDEWLNALIWIGQHHYDGKCRAAVHPGTPADPETNRPLYRGQPRGFIQRWKVEKDMGCETTEVSVDELDLCRKIIEVIPPSAPEDVLSGAAEVMVRFGEAFNWAQEIYKTWNYVLEDLPVREQQAAARQELRKQHESLADGLDWLETPYVSCDQACFALREPKTSEEFKAALEHWQKHAWTSGCAHGR